MIPCKKCRKECQEYDYIEKLDDYFCSKCEFDALSNFEITSRLDEIIKLLKETFTK